MKVKERIMSTKQKVKDTCKKYKKQILIGLGASAALGGIAYLAKKGAERMDNEMIETTFTEEEFEALEELEELPETSEIED